MLLPLLFDLLVNHSILNISEQKFAFYLILELNLVVKRLVPLFLSYPLLSFVPPHLTSKLHNVVQIDD